MNIVTIPKPAEGELRAAYLESMAELGQRRGRLLGDTLGTISLVFGFYEYLATPEVFFDTLVLRVLFLAVCAVLVFSNFHGRWTHLAPWMGAMFVLAMFGMMEGIVLASDPTKPIYPFNGLTLLGPAAALMLPMQMRHGASMILFILVGHAAVCAFSDGGRRMPFLVNEMFVLAASSLITLVALRVTDGLRWRVFRAGRDLEHEKARSERLLLNVLPEAIAHRLKTEDGAIADRSDQVSILFASPSQTHISSGQVRA
jgi:hypothetical protein